MCTCCNGKRDPDPRLSAIRDPTPQAVLDAMQTVAAFVRQGGWHECRIPPDGVGSFWLETTAERLEVVTDLAIAMEDRLTAENARLRAALTAAQLPHDGECPTHWGSARRNCTCRIGAHNAALAAALGAEACASVGLDYTADGRPQTQVVGE